MAWVTAVTDATALGVRSFVAELSVAPLPTAPFRGIAPFRYVDQPIFLARDDEVEGLSDLIAIYRVLCRSDGTIKAVNEPGESEPWSDSSSGLGACRRVGF